MNNQANIREFFGKLQAASNSNAPLPWELLHTAQGVADRHASVQGAPVASRSASSSSSDYGVGLPPMAGN